MVESLETSAGCEPVLTAGSAPQVSVGLTLNRISVAVGVIHSPPKCFVVRQHTSLSAVINSHEKVQTDRVYARGHIEPSEGSHREM